MSTVNTTNSENASPHGYKPVYVFIALTAVISSIFIIPINVMNDHYAGDGTFLNGLMFSPGIAGILTAAIFKIPVSSFGWRWGKNRYNLWSYLLPFLYISLTYVIVWTAGWAIFNDPDNFQMAVESFGMQGQPTWFVLTVFIVMVALFLITMSASTAIGEEIGWRGFLFSQLEGKMSYVKISLITGVIWTAWHVPIIVGSDYNSGNFNWYGLTCFTVMLMSLTFVFTWFRMKSGSIWTGVILHASHNMSNGYIYGRLNKNIPGVTEYYGGEFGIVLAVICFVMAIAFWSKRKLLIADESKAA